MLYRAVQNIFKISNSMLQELKNNHCCHFPQELVLVRCIAEDEVQ